MKNTIVGIALILASVTAQAQKNLSDAIKDLATEISTSAAKQQKQKIAVLPFLELDGQATVLGTYLAEGLVTNLFQIGNFDVVERQLLDKVMSELKIEQSGAIEPSTAKEIGRLTGVDAIVTGSITDLQSYVGINCRIIDSSSGKIFGAAQTKIAKDDDVKKIMSTPAPPDRQRQQRSATRQMPNVVTESGFRFALESCAQRNARITCSIVVTNTQEKDRLLSFFFSKGHPTIALFDDGGNQYLGSTVVFGASRAHADESVVGNAAEQTLSPDVPVRVTMAFDDVETTVNRATLRFTPSLWSRLDLLNSYFPQTKDPVVLLRNIPISR